MISTSKIKRFEATLREIVTLQHENFFDVTFQGTSVKQNSEKGKVFEIVLEIDTMSFFFCYFSLYKDCIYPVKCCTVYSSVADKTIQG